MAVASYVSDLSDIFMFESTTGCTATGGGSPGLSAGVDFAMEGTNAVDKQVTASYTRGFFYDNVSDFSDGTQAHFYLWVTTSTPGTNRGLYVIMGDADPGYVQYEVANVAYPGGTGMFNGCYLDLAGDCYAIRYAGYFEDREGDGHWQGVFGSGVPDETANFIGCEKTISGSAKGPNLACDGARLGTGYDITGGTGADTEADFDGIAADDASTSEGVFKEITHGGGYELLGKLRIGSSTTACEFLDSNKLIGIKLTGHAQDDFSEILIEHADTIVNLTNITFRGFWTYNRGRFEVITSAAEVNLTGCTFQNFGKTVLGTGSTCHNCNWVNGDIITANGADLTGSLIRDYQTVGGSRDVNPNPDVEDTSPLIWDVNTDPDGLLDDMTIIKGTESTHAIEFGTTSPTSLTLNGIDFSGYNASNAQNDSTFHIKRTSGTVTITAYGCTGNLSYKTAGATVVIIDNPATFQLHVISQSTGNDISGARAHVEADSTGPLPYQDSVTITRSGATASVAHTGHGLSNGEKVIINGADQDEYNHVHTISNVSTNAYDYTVSGSPTTPATGTIISTAVIISGTTDGNGLISDSRPYSSDQDYTGRVRDSSGSPFYKNSPISGTIDSDAGTTVTVQMVLDE